jgi:hypothetical protein
MITSLGMAIILGYAIIKIMNFYGVGVNVYGIYLVFYGFLVVAYFILPTDNYMISDKYIGKAL